MINNYKFYAALEAVKALTSGWWKKANSVNCEVFFEELKTASSEFEKMEKELDQIRTDSKQRALDAAEITALKEANAELAAKNLKLEKELQALKDAFKEVFNFKLAAPEFRLKLLNQYESLRKTYAELCEQTRAELQKYISSDSDEKEADT